MTQAAAHLLYDNRPDWGSRSDLEIQPGLWQMRNGHTARVDSAMNLEYRIGAAIKQFPIWKGVCVECNEPRTWNSNGTYAAIGRHQFDIIGELYENNSKASS